MIAFKKLIPLYVLSLITLIALGIWQLNRHYEKSQMIQEIETNLLNAPTIIDFNNKLDAAMVYKKMAIKGDFSNDKPIFLYGRKTATSQKDGYYMLHGFKVKNSDDKLLVARAWVPLAVKEQIESGALTLELSDIKEITGVILPAEKKPFFVPENDIDKNIWFTLSPEDASANGINIHDVYLRELDATNIPNNSMALDSKYISKIKNDHFEYALTWFMLAFAISILFLYQYLMEHQALKNFK